MAPRPARSAATPLLRAKFSPPNPASRAIERPHLIEALAAHAERPLTLIAADAGFGKTTLVAAFVRTLRRPVVWCSLMPSDAELIVFGRALLEGFRIETPRFGAGFHRALADARPGARSADMLGGTFANELAALRGPVRLLVLEDFHEVSAQSEVVTFMGALLRQLPPTVRVLITTRGTTSLPVERLRARGESFELDSGHLRFTQPELTRLATQTGTPPDAASVAALEDATGGWPTAVQVVLDSLRRGGGALPDVIAEFRVSGLELQDYFSAEVYRRLTPDARSLLEHTAALTRFDAPLAAALSERRDVRARLEDLARRGLLRSFGGGSTASYEWHDLVRRFVREAIEERDGPEAWRALEARTAAALKARGEREPALRHLLAAGLEAEATELLRLLAAGLVRDGRSAALLAYVADLPIAADDLELRLACADAHSALGHWDEAEPHYGDVLAAARVKGARAVEARALLGLGKVLNLRGRHEQVLGMSERGLAMAESLPVELRARLLQMKASAHFYLGQYRAAIAILDEVRDLLTDVSDPELILPMLHNRAVAYASQGRYREASLEFRAALAQVRGSASPRAALYLSNLAVLLLELGELAEARRAAEEGLQAARRFSNRAQEATCLQALADALAQSGDLDGATGALRQAEELDRELRMEVIAADLLALRGRLFCARGQYRRAVEYLDEAIARAVGPPESPRVPHFRALSAWCELRAGRANVAKERLLALRAVADAGENDDLRMRAHYWLAEARLALGEPRGADEDLRIALSLVRERGYSHFLRVQTREEPAPVLHALTRGIEVDTCAAALAEAGTAIEEPLLELAKQSPPAIAEAAIAVLGEIGGTMTRELLPEAMKRRRALQPAVRAALRHVDERARRAGAEAKSGEAPPARLVVFGPPRLEIAGRPLAASAWQTQRAFQVLVFLALHPRGANRDELLEHFWPGRQLAAGKRNFHPTLSYVRRTLPRAGVLPLLRDGEVYRLHPDYPLTCDAWEFQSALDAARRAPDDAERRAALERAVALAERPPFEGLYASWVDELQRRLRERMESALIDLGRLQFEAGDPEPALATLRRAAELDDLRESTRVSIIECLVTLGNRAAAVVEHERLRERLRSELGVDLMPETEEAIRRALGGTARHPQPAARQ